MVCGVSFFSPRWRMIASRLLGIKVGEKRLAHSRGMYFHAPSNPGVHLDEAGRLDLLHVHRFAVIKDGKMGCDVNLVNQVLHNR